MIKSLKRYSDMTNSELSAEVLESRYVDRMPALTRELAMRLQIAEEDIKRLSMLSTLSDSR